MATSRVKTNLFPTFEIAAKWQYVCYTQRSYRLISLNQPTNAKKKEKILILSVNKLGQVGGKRKTSTTVGCIHFKSLFDILKRNIEN